VGFFVGLMLVGFLVGLLLGSLVGFFVGNLVGFLLGNFVGERVVGVLVVGGGVGGSYPCKSPEGATPSNVNTTHITDVCITT
jgi:hypothetical protein